MNNLSPQRESLIQKLASQINPNTTALTLVKPYDRNKYNVSFIVIKSDQFDTVKLQIQFEDYLNVSNSPQVRPCCSQHSLVIRRHHLIYAIDTDSLIFRPACLISLEQQRKLDCPLAAQHK